MWYYECFIDSSVCVCVLAEGPGGCELGVSDGERESERDV